MSHQPPHEGVAQKHGDEYEHDHRQRLQNQVQHDTVLQLHLGRPLGVYGCELLFGLDAVVVDARESVVPCFGS